jgi:hypothetical protein
MAAQIVRVNSIVDFAPATDEPHLFLAIMSKEGTNERNRHLVTRSDVTSGSTSLMRIEDACPTAIFESEHVSRPLIRLTSWDSALFYFNTSDWALDIIK